MGTIQARNVRLLTALLLLAAAVVPLFVVLPRPAVSHCEYVFKARIEEFLGESTNGQLTYLAASAISGRAPADNVVLSFDGNYTRGWAGAHVDIGDVYWFEGDVMTPEVYYGEQYIFYGPPQLYLRQMKTGVLWPDQMTELRVLYLSPLSTMAAPVQLPMIFRSDSLSARIVLVLALRCILIAAGLVFVVRKRRSRESIIAALSIYALIAILLSLPVLGDLY